jgi:hypothetical protein
MTARRSPSMSTWSAAASSMERHRVSVPVGRIPGSAPLAAVVSQPRSKRRRPSNESSMSKRSMPPHIPNASRWNRPARASAIERPVARAIPTESDRNTTPSRDARASALQPFVEATTASLASSDRAGIDRRGSSTLTTHLMPRPADPRSADGTASGTDQAIERSTTGSAISSWLNAGSKGRTRGMGVAVASHPSRPQVRCADFSEASTRTRR